MFPVRARAMGFLSLFSSFMYKGSYNVEVRLTSPPAALPHALLHAVSNCASASCSAVLARCRGGSPPVPGRPASARRALARHRGDRGPGARAATLCECSRRRAAQVTVADSEPAESALRRFRKSVLNSGVLPEVRH